METDAGSKLASSTNTPPDLDDISFKSTKKLTAEEKELRDQKRKEAREKRKEERKNKLKSQIPSFSYQVSPVNTNPELAQSKYSITAENIEIDFGDSSLLYNFDGETFNAGDYLSILSKTKYTYEITGKIYNSITSEPLSGVEVKLAIQDPNSTGNTNITGSDQGIDVNNSEISIDPSDYIYIPTPGLTLIKTTPKIFSITRTSTQETQNPPYSTYIVPQFSDSPTILTDSKGEFKILVNLPTIPANQKVPLFWALTFTKKGFIPNSISILNGDSTVKSDLQSVGMVDIKNAAALVSAKYISELDEVQRKVDNIILEPIDKIIAYRRKGIGNLVNSIKTKLIPLCLELLITFGITKISQSNQKTCPTPESLNEVIRKRNQVTRQLNQIYQSIAINTALAVAFFALSNVLKGIKLKIDGLKIPQAIGIPPAKDFGGLIFAQSYSLTGKLQQISDLIEKLSEQNKSLNKNILVSLIFLIAGITTAILLLNAVDKLSQECAEEGGVTLPEQEAINAELLALTEESETEGNPIVSSINGFELSVVPDDKNLVGTLKRRYAVAKNQQGVIQLKGKPSFSSNDQILIDELVFYIQQNDLKAF
jgi:hypothetical protein